MRLLPALLRSRSVAESPVDESRLAAAGGRLRPLMAASAVVLLVVLLVSAIAPSAAQAGGVLGSGIGPSIGPSVLPNVGGAISNGIVGLAVDAFKAIIKALFAPIAKFVTVDLIHWVVEVPNFAQGHFVPQPRRRRPGRAGALREPCRDARADRRRDLWRRAWARWRRSR